MRGRHARIDSSVRTKGEGSLFDHFDPYAGHGRDEERKIV
jgi:hypothetical protein